MLMVFGSEVKGQRVYANTQRSGTTGGLTNGGSVDNPTFASDAISTNFAHLTAWSTLGSGNAWSQLIFPTSVPSNSIVYVQIKIISTSLLGNEINTTGYNGSTPNPGGVNGSAVATTSSSTLASGDGFTYLVATPTSIFNSLRTTLFSPIALGTNIIDIYSAFYIVAPVVSGTTICSGSKASLSVSSPVTGLTYNWYTAATGGDLVNTGTSYSPNLTANTTYYVEAADGGEFFSARTPVTVTVNPLPTLSTTQTATIITTSGTVAFTATSSASTIKWYDNSGVLKFTGANPTFGPFSTPGTYTYQVIADNGTCSNSSTVSFSVYSTTACPPLTKRVYGSSSTWSSVITGSVSDNAFAADGDPTTNSTLTSAIGLLGIGTVTQNVFWTNTVTAGTPATIKLGLGSGLLSLASNVSVVGIKKNGVLDPIEIGTPQIVNASLLKLLPGDNTFEFTLTPSDNTGPKSYDGVRVILGSLLSLAQTARVFDAYYYTPTPTVDCTKGDVTDIVYGVKDLGIGALTVTVGVNNPWQSVDGNVNTYATMLSGAGVLAQAREQIIFSSASLPSDSLKIIVSTGASLLGVNLLTGFSIQRYLGGSPVGSPIDNTSTLLSIKLLAGNTRAAIVLAPTPEPYDRVEILYGGVANVLTSINIHEVQRITSTKLSSAPDNDNKITVCKGENITLPTPLDNCTTFKWYDAAVGGNVITGSTINTGTYASGVHTFYIQPVRFGCELMGRGAVTVTINTQPVLATIPAQPLCNNSPSLDLSTLNPTDNNGTTGGTYVWSLTQGGTALGSTTVTPALGSTTYWVRYTKNSCSADQSVVVTVNPLPSAGTITGNSNVCVSQTISLSNATAGGTWTSSDLTKATVNVSGVVTGVATGSAIITYTVTNPTTGCTNSTSKSITVNPIPSPGTITGNSSVCVNQTISLSNAVSGGTWASTDITKATINSSGVVTGIAQGQTTITYTVTNAGCSSAAAVVITVNPLPNASISGTTTVCQGAATQTITFTGSNGTNPYTFTYNINGGSNTTITTASGDNTVTIPVSTSLQGTLNFNLLSVMDASSTQCSNTQTGTATIKINPKPLTPHIVMQ